MNKVDKDKWKKFKTRHIKCYHEEYTPRGIPPCWYYHIGEKFTAVCKCGASQDVTKYIT